MHISGLLISGSGSGLTILLLVCCLSAKTGFSSSISQGVNGTFISAVSGSTASLPCHTSRIPSRDQTTLILWFKEEEGKPIFSVDVNGLTDLTFARIWSSPTHFGERATFQTKDRLTSLLIVSNIRGNESGLYRCRVDFRDAPSSNSFLNLDIIVLPKKVVIFDEKWSERNTFVGPYLEGDDMNLICEAVGGRPSPVVTWLKGGSVVSAEYEELNNGSVRRVSHQHNTVFSLHLFSSPQQAALFIILLAIVGALRTFSIF